ncbi:unnamed protein product [Spirodela intermedia]|uniref:Uncharacterized protein n=2 Tax=Spirodela intermedia TaxID=51605 RepID=A0A7I8KPD9_SPIIN|nr:unnamed protein product [Spirodela intermedia]CAA6663043.1 unnamed protein product [Spirodela intermedia]CAA7399471.1 unnamed protein product [Spirodela intermedia]
MLSSRCVGGGEEGSPKVRRWAESDAEFLRGIAEGEEGSPATAEQLRRRRVLKSYTFSRKEGLVEKLRRWLLEKKRRGKVKREKDVTYGPSCFKLAFSCAVRVDLSEP